MPSESARASSAAEARFRIAAPNALPRRVAIVPLDAAARALVAEVAALGWRQGLFVGLEAGQDWLAELPGRTRALVEAIEAASLVVLVATAGTDAQAAGMVAEAAAARRRMVAAVLIDPGEADAAARENSLAALRPHAGMLVVAEDADYLAAMLQALRA
jgi:hypothetical protein